MNEDTGEVVPYDEIPESNRARYSKPFHEGEIVEVKGLSFKITRFKRGRLFLKLVKPNTMKRTMDRGETEVRKLKDKMSAEEKFPGLNK